MTDRERIRRPSPERTGPIRKWDGLLGIATLNDPEASGSAAKSPQAEDVLARSVELGYRVVDEYLTRGQEAAQRLRRGVYGAEEIAQDVQSVASQLVRSASDFAGAWVEFFALAGRDATVTQAAGHAPAPESVRPVGAAVEATTAASVEGPIVAPLRVRLSVASVRPVETALDMDPIPASHGLVVQQLRLVTDGTIRISDVCVEPGEDGVTRIRVAVPNDQAPGRYSGMVVDDTTNVPAGELTIVVPPFE